MDIENEIEAACDRVDQFMCGLGLIGRTTHGFYGAGSIICYWEFGAEPVQRFTPIQQRIGRILWEEFSSDIQQALGKTVRWKTKDNTLIIHFPREVEHARQRQYALSA